MRPRAVVPLLIAVAGASLVACGGAGVEVRRGLREQETVTVTISGTSAPFDIVPDPAFVFPGDRLQFAHSGAERLEIDLRGVPRVAILPFADSLLTAFDGEIAFTTVLASAQPDTIKYSVTVTIGGQSSTEDPEIIVRPR